MQGLEQKIRAVLLEDWDPIGVTGSGDATDEYDNEVSAIAEMIRAGQLSLDLVRHYLDDRAYELFPAWNDNDGLDRATSRILALGHQFRESKG